MIITPTVYSLTDSNYIAGSGDGIVTIAGKPASRKIWLLNAKTMLVEQVVASKPNGRYVFLNIGNEKEYLVIARDHKKEFEPFAWDYIKPSSGLTLDMLQAK